MTIIAFHGDYASPNMLREDIGDIGLPIKFSAATDIWEATQDILQTNEKISLIGYSRGCSFIADISVRFYPIIKNVVLYEGPLGEEGKVRGNFPVLIIWNDKGVKNPNLLKPWEYFRYMKALKMEETWSRTHPVSYLQGKGHHIKIDPTKQPKRRHGWDQSLNPNIKLFLES